MTQYIRIINDTVEIVAESISQAMPLARFEEAVADRILGQRGDPNAWQSPILPPGTTYFAYNPMSDRMGLLVHKPAHMTDIRMGFANTDNIPDRDRDRVDDEEGTGIWRVSVPHTYFWFDVLRASTSNPLIDSSRLFWSPTAITSPDSPLYAPLLPNLHGGGEICWGDTSDPADTFNGRIATTVNDYYLSRFNDDLGVHVPYGSFTEWEGANEFWYVRNSEIITLAGTRAATNPRDLHTNDMTMERAAQEAEAAATPPIDLNALRIQAESLLRLVGTAP